MSSDSSGATLQIIPSEKGLQNMASAPTESEWFTRFMTGLHSNIGEHRKQDAAISIGFLIETQRLLELDWQLSVNQNDKERIRTADKIGSIHIFTYCGS